MAGDGDDKPEGQRETRPGAVSREERATGRPTETERGRGAHGERARQRPRRPAPGQRAGALRLEEPTEGGGGTTSLRRKQLAAALERDAQALDDDAARLETQARRHQGLQQAKADRELGRAAGFRDRARQLRADAVKVKQGRLDAPLPGPEDLPDLEEKAVAELGDPQVHEQRPLRIPLDEVERAPAKELTRLRRPIHRSAAGNRMVYRVEGRRRQLFTVDAAGNVKVVPRINPATGRAEYPGAHLNFGSPERAADFLKKRPGGRIVSFEVDEEWVRSLRSATVPETNTGALRKQLPQLVDVRMAEDQIYVPGHLMEELEDFIVPGSGRITGGGVPVPRLPRPSGAAQKSVVARQKLITALEAESRRVAAFTSRLKTYVAVVGELLAILDAVLTLRTMLAIASEGTLFPEEQKTAELISRQADEARRWADEAYADTPILPFVGAVEEAKRFEDIETLMELASTLGDAARALGDPADEMLSQSYDLELKGRAARELSGILTDLVKSGLAGDGGGAVQALATGESLRRLSGPLTNAAEYYGQAGEVLGNLRDFLGNLASEATTAGLKLALRAYAEAVEKP
jgi:hypothetical protein